MLEGKYAWMNCLYSKKYYKEKIFVLSIKYKVLLSDIKYEKL